MDGVRCEADALNVTLGAIYIAHGYSSDAGISQGDRQEILYRWNAACFDPL
jgi:hypothetical protein